MQPFTQQRKNSKRVWQLAYSKRTSLACMFCSPISDHVMLLGGNSFFQISSYARANVRITNGTKVKFQ